MAPKKASGVLPPTSESPSKVPAGRVRRPSNRFTPPPAEASTTTKKNLRASKVTLTRSQEQMPPPPPPPRKLPPPAHSREPSGSPLTPLSRSATPVEGIDPDLLANEEGGGKGKGKDTSEGSKGRVKNWGNEKSSNENELRSAEEALVDFMAEPGVYRTLKRSMGKSQLEKVRTRLKQLGFAGRSDESIKGKVKSIIKEFKATYDEHYIDSGGSRTEVGESIEEMITRQNPHFYTLFDALAESSSAVAPRFRMNTHSGVTLGGAGQPNDEDDQFEILPSNETPDRTAPKRKMSQRSQHQLDAIMKTMGMDGEEEGEEEEDAEEDGDGDGDDEEGFPRLRKFRRVDGQDTDDASLDLEDFQSLPATPKTSRHTPAKTREGWEKPVGKKASSTADVLASGIGGIAAAAQKAQEINMLTLKAREKRDEGREGREERRLRLDEESATHSRELANRNAALQEQQAKTNMYIQLVGGGMPHNVAMGLAFGQGMAPAGGGGEFGGMGMAGAQGGFRAPEVYQQVQQMQGNEEDED